jgi:hypothetical protein
VPVCGVIRATTPRRYDREEHGEQPGTSVTASLPDPDDAQLGRRHDRSADGAEVLQVAAQRSGIGLAGHDEPRALACGLQDASRESHQR